MGAGTVISTSIPDQIRACGAGTQSDPKSLTQGQGRLRGVSSLFPRIAAKPGQWGSAAFRVGQVAFDQFPLKVWSNLVSRHCRNMDAGSTHYREPDGF